MGEKFLTLFSPSNKLTPHHKNIFKLGSTGTVPLLHNPGVLAFGYHVKHAVNECVQCVHHCGEGHNCLCFLNRHDVKATTMTSSSSSMIPVRLYPTDSYSFMATSFSGTTLNFPLAALNSFWKTSRTRFMAAFP